MRKVAWIRVPLIASHAGAAQSRVDGANGHFATRRSKRRDIRAAGVAARPLTVGIVASHPPQEPTRRKNETISNTNAFDVSTSVNECAGAMPLRWHCVVIVQYSKYCKVLLTGTVDSRSPLSATRPTYGTLDEVQYCTLYYVENVCDELTRENCISIELWGSLLL